MSKTAPIRRVVVEKPLLQTNCSLGEGNIFHSGLLMYVIHGQYRSPVRSGDVNVAFLGHRAKQGKILGIVTAAINLYYIRSITIMWCRAR